MKNLLEYMSLSQRNNNKENYAVDFNCNRYKELTSTGHFIVISYKCTFFSASVLYIKGFIFGSISLSWRYWISENCRKIFTHL